MPDSFFQPDPRQSGASAASIAEYEQRKKSFIVGLDPQTALSMPVYQVLDILSRRLGFDEVRKALGVDFIQNSPHLGEVNGDWLQSSRMVGINVRTVGNFFNVVKYALTLPHFHDSIHLLPIWEPGVVGSLYGMVSWEINP